MTNGLIANTKNRHRAETKNRAAEPIPITCTTKAVPVCIKSNVVNKVYSETGPTRYCETIAPNTK